MSIDPILAGAIGTGLVAIGAAIGLSPEQIRALFETARDLDA